MSALERVETDNKDRPIEDLVIERCLVFVDPFAEVDEQVIMRINRQFLAIQIWFDFI